ncbi:MAG: single-stranded DNA-binding protein [Nocardioidaceae bacterium]
MPHESSTNNEVRLYGRISAEPVERELPSGDRVVSLRLIVDRPRHESDQRKHVDVIDLACWTKRSRTAALRRLPGDKVMVVGALRRRFFTTSQGRTSRYEVEVHQLRKVTATELAAVAARPA